MGMSRSRFRPNSKILDAAFIDTPAFSTNQKHRGARRAGITFEKRVGEFLNGLFGNQVVSNSWISYFDESNGDRICSPDHLIIDVKAGVVTVVECKLSHTANAWYQLNDVYAPVIKFLFPGFDVRLIEICKNYERSISYPQVPRIVCDLHKEFKGGDNVMVLRDL